ncbi:TIGR02922 family protein [Colwellia psychrerythraea]|uniref:TIGR02922 family protein n=1 Tax=Colwellia psychrerythraea TaxID=28229 RepID=A0A099KC69_COLPS|nr:TIGR02922 family protein [Colwellia psychrerythraea]KGJ88334.1 Conserved hypothetical protein CHP02922 [Colwellia psychrerythraea]
MKKKTVSIFYYCEDSVELGVYIGECPLAESGRVVIAPSFKKGKAIISVCEGRVKVLNKLGDRPLNQTLAAS